jgi:hypothetical protein
VGAQEHLYAVLLCLIFLPSSGRQTYFRGLVPEQTILPTSGGEKKRKTENRPQLAGKGERGGETAMRANVQLQHNTKLQYFPTIIRD